MKFVRTFAALTLGLAIAGCGSGDGLPREPISGSVSVDGKPVARGSIRFSTSSDAPEAMEVGGLIEDGKYNIPRSEGPVPGTYKVMITEEDVVEGPPADPSNPFHSRPMPKPSKLTAMYRKGLALSAEVKKDQSEPIDFDIKVDGASSSATTAQGGQQR